MLSHPLRAAAGYVAPSSSSISYVGMASSTTSTTGSTTCSVPSGAQAGDLLLAFSVQTASTTSVNMLQNLGWAYTYNTNGKFSAYLPSWDGTTSTYTFSKSTASSTYNHAVVILAFRNADVGITGSMGSSSGTSTVTAPSITLAESSSAVIAFYSSPFTSNTYSQPTDYTEVYDGGNGFALDYKLNVASGATGTVASTVTGGTVATGMLFSLYPKSSTRFKFVGVNTNTSSTATSITVNNVPDVQDNDSLFLFATYYRNSGTTSTSITTPSGWTEIWTNVDLGASGGYRLSCAYRKTASSEGSSYTLVNADTVAGAWTVGLLAIRDSSAFDTFARTTPTGTAGTLFTAPSLTVAASNSIVITVGSGARGNTTSILLSTLPGQSVINSTSASTQNTSLGVSIRLGVAAGTLAASSVAFSNSVNGLAANIVIKD